MIKLLAETPRDQKIVDVLKKAGKWKDKKLEEKKKKIEELEKELEEYRKRHPANFLSFHLPAFLSASTIF